MQKGFTLIELMLVIALMLTIGILSVAFYNRFLMQNAVADATDTLVGSLHRAQLFSMMGKYNGTWGVKISSGSIVVFQGESYSARRQAMDEVSAINESIITNGLDEVVFARASGLPSVTPTVTLTGNDSVRTLKINSQGIIER